MKLNLYEQETYNIDNFDYSCQIMCRQEYDPNEDTFYRQKLNFN